MHEGPIEACSLQTGAVSFDVYLMHFERGQPADADRDAVALVLRELAATGPDNLGRYELPASDLWMIREGSDDVVNEFTIVADQGAAGGRYLEPYLVAVDASGLDGQEEFDGCSLFLRAFSPSIAQAIFRIAEAGGLTIVAVSEAAPFLPPSVDFADLPEADYFAEPRRVGSGDELFTALSAGFDRHRRWRDQVVTRPAVPSRGSRLSTWSRRRDRRA